MFQDLPTQAEIERRYLLHVLDAVGRQPHPRRAGPRHRPPHAVPHRGELRPAS